MNRHLPKSGWSILLKSVRGTFCSLFFILLTPAAQAILDKNGNLVSDLWEKQFNNGELFPATFDPNADDDQDGWSNILEAAAGTDPKNPNPPDGLIQPVTAYHPAVEGVENSVPGVTVTWPTLTGKEYTILFSPDLAEGSWLPVEEPFIAEGGENTYGFNELQLADKRFWRVAVEDVDMDSDGLNNHEESIIGTNPDLSATFTGLPDAWLALYYTSVTTFVPTQDHDWDGLTNFAEYLHRTNPLNPDTDGDGTWDGTEVGQGGNPNNPGDGGNPPSDSVEDVEFTVGGDYATWRMEIKATGPRDNRTLNLTSPQPGQNETQSFKLWKNNRYEITLHRTGGYEDWYCWQAQTDGQPAASTFDADGWVSDGARNDQAHFFTVAGHWLADNRQGLLSGHIHSLDLDVVSPLKAELIPVAIEDNIEATGVDIVSNSVAPNVDGYQENLWIMAPIAGPPPPADYSNLMKFHIPLSPAADLEIECDHAAADPATVTLNNAKPEALWRGTGANQTSDNVPGFKIGEHLDEVDLPIRVKTMKHRTVKVGVYPVRCKPGNRNVPMPNEGVLENWLNQVFAYQLNAWFDVEYKPQTDYDYDPDNDGIALYWTKLIPMSQQAIYQDASNDIRLFVIDWVSLRELGPQGLDLNGIAQLDPPLAVVNAGLPGVPARPAQQVIETIAHELGHVLVGEGHPDEGGGRAPLPGTDHSKRLMSTLATRAPGAKLLVKKEWDKAEEWLAERPTENN